MARSGHGGFSGIGRKKTKRSRSSSRNWMKQCMNHALVLSVIYVIYEIGRWQRDSIAKQWENKYGGGVEKKDDDVLIIGGGVRGSSGSDSEDSGVVSRKDLGGLTLRVDEDEGVDGSGSSGDGSNDSGEDVGSGDVDSEDGDSGDGAEDTDSEDVDSEDGDNGDGDEDVDSGDGDEDVDNVDSGDGDNEDVDVDSGDGGEDTDSGDVDSEDGDTGSGDDVDGSKKSKKEDKMRSSELKEDDVGFKKGKSDDESKKSKKEKEKKDDDDDSNDDQEEEFEDNDEDDDTKPKSKKSSSSTDTKNEEEEKKESISSIHPPSSTTSNTITSNNLKSPPRDIQLPLPPPKEPQRPTKPKIPPTKIKRIALLGERNSGTRWIYSELRRCFGHYLSPTDPDRDSKTKPHSSSSNRTIEIKSHLTRWKHWFQPSWDATQKHDPTLVLSIFRNPYEWVEAMRVTPHHAPDHLSKKHGMDWEEFVTKPWTMSKRPRRDVKLEEKRGRVCYEHFEYDELVSCVEGTKDDEEYRELFDNVTGLNIFGRSVEDEDRLDFSAHKPVYEMQVETYSNGTIKKSVPYDSIVAMRADKIRNFLGVAEWDWISDSIPIRYETLLEEGTDEALLKVVEDATGLNRKCESKPPQDKRKKRMLDPDFVDWMNRNVDWKVEDMVGYEKMEGVVHRVSVLGERHSGESITYKTLQKCFPGKRIEDKLVREKHCFQYPEGANETHTPTLVLFQVRDPYVWVEAMRRGPISAPNHLGFLPWKEFVTRPWTTKDNERPQRDLDWYEANGTDTQTNLCQKKFHYDEILSCVEGTRSDPEYLSLFDPKTKKNVLGFKLSNPHDYSAEKPIYELRPDGTPYRSIVDLRADKIKNVLETKHWPWVADVIPVPFESLIVPSKNHDATSKGLEYVVSIVERFTGWKRSCTSIRPTTKEVVSKFWRKYWTVGFEPGYVQWMNQELDWELEGLVGYKKRKSPKEGSTKRVALYEGMKVKQDTTGVIGV